MCAPKDRELDVYVRHGPDNGRYSWLVDCALVATPFLRASVVQYVVCIGCPRAKLDDFCIAVLASQCKKGNAVLAGSKLGDGVNRGS